MSIPAPEVIIASNVGPTYHGGLATYQKVLGQVLRREGVSGQFVFAHTSAAGLVENPVVLPYPHHQAAPTKIGSATQKLRASLGSRPWSHGMLQPLLAESWQWPALKPGLRVVHCVGRGWDYFGFSAHAFARRNSAKFTIWPASHPKESGDDVLDLRLYGLADTVFCQSEFEADYLVSLGLDRKKTRICGLPPMCLSNGNAGGLRRKLGLGSRPVVFFLGRGSAEKGFTALQAAWPKVLQKVPDAVVLWAGPGTDKPHSLPADSVRELGVIDEATKANAYAACDVFCLPSAHESFGIVYVEAWSYGKPVICGTAPSSRELVQDGVTGLWAGQNPEELAEKLVFLLANRSDAEGMGKNGFELQQKRFTETEMLRVHREAWGL